MTPADAHTGLVAAGYVMAVVIPLIGFTIGIALLVKGKLGHGIGAMTLSVLAVMSWSSVLAGTGY